MANMCANEVAVRSDAISGSVLGEILEKVKDSEHFKDIDSHLRQLDVSVCRESTSEQEKARRWLQWAVRRGPLKAVTTPVPHDILPAGCGAILTDVKVFTKRGPDDPIFDNNPDIREKVARGNCFLDVSDGPRTCMSCVIYALKKFTGGLGDDDDRDKGDNFTWQKYFTKPLDATRRIVCTRKANGEAAHLSCVLIGDQLTICGGSKNVHMLIRKKEDIDNYTAPRFRIAREVCVSIMDSLEKMGEENKNRLLRFLALTRFTAIFEILSPSHQHVEDLSHLSSGVLQFITWTSVELEPSPDSQLSALPPHVAIEIARGLGLQTVEYDIISYSDLEDRMKKIRQGYNFEGEVLYFLDCSSNVIGLLKKKTIWYILCRAIREKAKNAAGIMAKSPSTFSVGTPVHKTERRIREIQTWLGLDETTVSAWKELGGKFIKWVVHTMEVGELSHSDIADQFPVTWKRFLKESDLTDDLHSTFNEDQTDAAAS